MKRILLLGCHDLLNSHPSTHTSLHLPTTPLRHRPTLSTITHALHSNRNQQALSIGVAGFLIAAVDSMTGGWVLSRGDGLVTEVVRRSGEGWMDACTAVGIEVLAGSMSDLSVLALAVTGLAVTDVTDLPAPDL